MTKREAANQFGWSKTELDRRWKAAGTGGWEEFYDRVKDYGGDYNAYKSAQRQKDLIKQQEGKVNDFMGRWNTKIASQPTMQDIWKRISDERGLTGKRDTFTGLMGQVGSVQEQLENAPEQIAGETRGYDVNAAQQARITQAKQGELAKTLSPIARAAETAGTGYNLALAEAGQQISSEQYQQEKELQPYLTEAQLLDSALARQVTMYTTDMQNQTNILLQKLKSSGALDQNEMDQLNQLALLERDYELKRNQFDYERKFKTSQNETWS